MQDTILEKLKEIEQGHQIKVLFAVESGSRAWGFPSKDSDYDVRFVYIRQRDWYLSIDEKRDVVEVPINDLLDMNGWDIRKALKLFRKSNPPLLEWLESSIIYQESYGFREEMRAVKEQVFSPKASMHHYLSMAKGNFRKYLQGEHVNIKKYFYVLRPILACLWIEKYNTNPPILFQELVEDLLAGKPELKKKMDLLLDKKMFGDEMDLEPRIDVINEFIQLETFRMTEYANSFQGEQNDPTEILDELYRKYLRIWD
ncbi:nucleotidyltransferase domain-containing protein [Paenibacillus agricola]|uniref:Nucleotidyltransferase domain-containing protein n=1 Tax=Paenibacillus agricola TaxID=2716264 RepID=A0ABX0J2E0_9BACL|nr:nucleotidyltransferase domain-containing protein [Paenibacillus agricola]NHN29605.1 nucleotidyltransferase domain-containing protein [Paenibacillus agricola]